MYFFLFFSFSIPFSHSAQIGPDVQIGSSVFTEEDHFRVPPVHLLPGPTPNYVNTLNRYSWLMDRCLASNPQRRPGFSEIAEILSEMANTEEAKTPSVVVQKPPFTLAREDSSGRKKGGHSVNNDDTLCVVCLDKPASVALVHAVYKE